MEDENKGTEESSSFSQTEKQLNEIQNEILRQGKDVEKFIIEHSKIHQNPAIKSLQILFELFKSELSINLSFRKALMNDKALIQQLKDIINKKNKEIPTVLTQLSDELNIRIEKISDITKIFQEIQNENQLLKFKLTQMTQEKEDINAQSIIEIAKHNSRAELAETQNQDYQNQLYELKSKYTKLIKFNEELQSNILLLKKKLSNHHQIKKENKELKEQINRHKHETESSNKQIQELKSKLKAQKRNQKRILTEIQNNITNQQTQNTIYKTDQKTKDIETKFSNALDENNRLLKKLQQSSKDISRLEEENAKLMSTLERYKHLSSSVMYDSDVSTPTKVKSSSFYSSEDISGMSNSSYILRPLMLATIACNRLISKNKNSSTNVSDSSFDVKKELVSLKREIVSLQSELAK